MMRFVVAEYHSASRLPVRAGAGQLTAPCDEIHRAGLSDLPLRRSLCSSRSSPFTGVTGTFFRALAHHDYRSSRSLGLALVWTPNLSRYFRTPRKRAVDRKPIASPLTSSATFFFFGSAGLPCHLVPVESVSDRHSWANSPAMGAQSSGVPSVRFIFPRHRSPAL